MRRSARAAGGSSGSLLVESVLLGLLGGALGAGLAYAGVRVLLAIGPPNLPRLSEIAVDARTLAFAASLSLLSSVLFGLIPAVKYTAPRIAAALGSLGRTTSVSRERHRPQRDGRRAGSDRARAPGERGLDDSNVPIHTDRGSRIHATRQSADPADLRLIGRPNRRTGDAHRERLQDKLASIPGVTSAAFGSAMPMEGSAQTWAS